MNNPEFTIRKNAPIWVIVLVALIIVISLWSANFYLLVDIEDKGILGDMFGVVNSLFSGLAFAGIIITIYLQRNELILQREELKLTRDEFKNQNVTLRLQRFENTFFNLLSLHHEIVKGIYFTKETLVNEDKGGFRRITDEIKTENITFTGRDVFQVCYNEIRSKLHGTKELHEISSAYISEYYKYQNHFDHYFRNLSQIIVLIDTTLILNHKNPGLELNEKSKYVDVVKAQLSTYELLWIYYNCLSSNGMRFKPLIEKYGFFNEDFILDYLVDSDHRNMYEISAFEKK